MNLPYTLAFSLPLLSTALFAQGELCTTAVLITPGLYTADGPSSGAGASAGDATNADWYAFDPLQAGYITVNSCVDGDIDSRVRVHSGTCTNLLLLGQDDDGCPTGYPPGNSLLAGVPVTPGGTIYIEWDDRWSGDSFEWELTFHDCPGPLPPSLTATDTTVTVSWAAQPVASGFTVEIGPAGFSPGTGTILSGTMGVDGPPVTFNGLMEGTDYEVYVTLDCGAGPVIGGWPIRTLGNPLVDNEDCFDALPLLCGDTVQGSTTLAFFDQVPNCGTDIDAAGIWYDFTGIAGSATLSTCNSASYDTRINVFAGACDSLLCVGGNDDAPGCDLTSQVTVLTTAGTVYHVLVQGYDGQVGDFSMSLSCNTCVAPSGLLVSPSDVLASVYWTSANGAGTYTLEFGPVGFTPGTGTVITGTLGIDGPPVLLNGLTAATEYDIYLQEDCGSGDLSPTIGPVPFTTTLDPLPANAFCNQAQAIACGDTITGNTNDGLLSPGPECAAAFITAPGLWYIFIGSDEDITVTTCGQASYDTKISVYTGSCGSLQCAAGTDDAVGCAANSSSVTFFAVNGTEYLVLVHGYDQQTGSFDLSLTCAPQCATVPPNDVCANATTLIPQPLNGCTTPVVGTNECAYGLPLPNPPCDPYANINDVWYTFNTGTEASHTITLEAVTAEVLNAAVYLACGDPQYVDCFTEVAAPIALTGLPLNTDVLVRVWNGGYADAGTFSICDQAAIPDAIAEYGTAGASVWPIPASDQLFVRGIPSGTKRTEVIDLQGRTVLVLPLDGHSANASVDVSALGTGSYLLRFIGSEQRPIRFVVER
ncbi:MAG: hypothetical protein IPK99_02490 [Flavobacteriales bacterium]|nr:hypothetical protein [Flavobacteriales bacterium]